ncbi:MAG: nitroreductase family protein [Candidatus Nealsonbacteria bacterium]
MEILEAIKQRRSCRQYKSDPVPEEKLNRILEAARLAPSARNSQSRKFVVVKGEEKRKELMKAANNQDFVGQAPIIIICVSTDPDNIMSCEVPTYAVDLSIAADHMILQATSEGLGTCWIGAFSQVEVKRILKIPENCKVVAMFPLGYPADIPKEKSRKELEEIVSFETF